MLLTGKRATYIIDSIFTQHYFVRCQNAIKKNLKPLAEYQRFTVRQNRECENNATHAEPGPIVVELEL